MIDQLVTFETAKLAEEKGFNGMCINRIHCSHFHTIINNVIPKNISIVEDFMSKPEDWNHKLHDNPNGGKKLIGLYLSIPTQSLLQRWLREKHDIHIIVKVFWDSKTNNRTYAADIYKIGDKPIMRKRKVESTYEEALEQGLIEALKLI